MAASESHDLLRQLGAELGPELEVIRHLDEGSAARVVLGREPALRRLVAIKVLRRDLTRDDRARRRFEREAKAAASVRHPSVASVHRVGGLADGRPFIVMEYIKGRTLAELLAARGRLPADEALAVLNAVCDALTAAHRQSVVHRDVRPENVMVETDTGRVALVDFGIAALLESDAEHITRLTRTGEQLGDPSYASPEQLRGEPATPASDVWALGVLGYELLGGEHPFPGATLAERIQAALEADPPVLTAPGLDPRAGDMLRRCLARDPRRRPRAPEVRVALDPAADAGAPAARQKTIREAAPISAALPAPLRNFLQELKRRKVYRVAAAYLAGGFLVLEGADLIAPVLNEQHAESWYRIIVAMTLAGFPTALVLSWLFDLEPGRRAVASPALPWKNRILPLVGLAVALAATVAAWLLLR